MAERQLDLLQPHEPDSGFVVRQSKRAKYLALTVAAHGVVEVVVPKRTSPASVERFVKKHQSWIDKTLSQFRRDHPAPDRSMPEQIFLPCIDKSWDVHYGCARQNFSVSRLSLTTERADLLASRLALQKFLQRTARQLLVPRLERLSVATGLSYQRVQVRGQRTRWGSYSSSGTLTINYCLLFLHPRLAEYLFLHELCHTRHMNHSRRFWQLVASLEPDYRMLEKTLDRAWREVPAWVGLH